MVKLDPEVLRYMSADEFRVLTAVEMGMKNHDLVPTEIICRIAGLKRGGARKMINNLHRNKLVYHEAQKYDGYRLTYAGYDYLALKTFSKRGLITAVGRQIGVGKESDIFEVLDGDGEPLVLKIHRLGRTSFRSIKTNRDYLLHRQSASWLYMSRLAANKEYMYLKALYDYGFRTPVPVDQNRHCVLMSKVDAFPFAQVSRIRHVASVYNQLQNMIVKLADHGLIHCDFNEFNLMIDQNERVTVIDFPQMVSTSHRNAKMYFERDVQCIRSYFEKRFGYHTEEYPVFERDVHTKIDLDKQLQASGSTHQASSELDTPLPGDDAMMSKEEMEAWYEEELLTYKECGLPFLELEEASTDDEAGMGDEEGAGDVEGADGEDREAGTVETSRRDQRQSKKKGSRSAQRTTKKFQKPTADQIRRRLRRKGGGGGGKKGGHKGKSGSKGSSNSKVRTKQGKGRAGASLGI